MKYKILINYNRKIKLSLKNRFVYSKLKNNINKIIFKTSRIVLFFLKYFAIIIRPFLPKIEAEKCDILVWGNSESHIKRSNKIWNLLREKNYNVKIIIPGQKRFLTKYIFKYKINFNPKVHYEIFFHHAFASYLTQKFDFKIICDYHNYEVTSALIKQELSVSQKSIFIPHGKIRNSIRHSCFTFDYYLVFGESSIEKIKENKFRLGSTKLIKTGSAFIPSTYILKPNNNFKNILFFSNWAVSYHPESKRGFEIVVNWAKQHPEYNLFIRLHPLEDGIYVKEKTTTIKNITVQDKSLTLKQSLENVSLTIATGSNASIEAAVMNRPSIVALDKDYNPNSNDVFESDSNFYLEKYFPERARNSEQLQTRIEQIFNNYEFYLKNCSEYVKYHLEYTTDASHYITEIIEKIYLGKNDFPYTEIQSI